ncbi:hypothetical protein HanRHA438_Chr09g0426471 [Helianthus annuus]|nr:hypothetical protein HanIR_Chr09g0446331 [Helianthus annuus]KAJ0890675.1 hypothetical protein HanRHA438_Chr09g0426471 [Helianthus annuus]
MLATFSCLNRSFRVTCLLTGFVFVSYRVRVLTDRVDPIYQP